MAKTSALSRASRKEIVDSQMQLAPEQARAAATSWMNITAAEDALAQLDAGVFAWRAAPAAQAAMASIMAASLSAKDTVMCVGFQAYAWTQAAGAGTDEILAIQLGKSLPQNVMTVTAEDVVQSMTKKAGKGMTVVAMHVESEMGWQDVRAVSAAAVKAERPVLILVSASVDAPRGVTIDRIADWTQAAIEIPAAAAQVRGVGAIRVLAMDDMDSASMEFAMMQASGMTPESWGQSLQKNADGAEMAVSTAYQAPVRSF